MRIAAKSISALRRALLPARPGTLRGRTARRGGTRSTSGRCWLSSPTAEAIVRELAARSVSWTPARRTSSLSNMTSLRDPTSPPCGSGAESNGGTRSGWAPPCTPGSRAWSSSLTGTRSASRASPAQDDHSACKAKECHRAHRRRDWQRSRELLARLLLAWCPETSIVVDAERLVPIEEHTGATNVRYSEWQDIGQGRWVPRRIDVIGLSVHYRMSFEWLGNAVWLLRKSEAITPEATFTQTRTQEHHRQRPPRLRGDFERRSAGRPTRAGARHHARPQPPWLDGGTTGSGWRPPFQTLSYSFHTVRRGHPRDRRDRPWW